MKSFALRSLNEKETVSQSNGGREKQDKQPDSKALECARLILEVIVVATKNQFFYGLEVPESHR
jgi:hypothetical protein